MKEYEIEAEEILQIIIKVEAENRDEAIMKVKDMYRNEEITLYAEDFKEVKFR